MTDAGEGPRSTLLDRLNKEATVAVSTANGYSIRSWLTSAKKCLDQVTPLFLFIASASWLIKHHQAEMDIGEGDEEAAYVNFVRAISIVVEVIPRHAGMK